MLNRQIIEFCCKEVHYQKRGPLQVWGMLRAWEHAMDIDLGHNTLGELRHFAYFIEPKINKLDSWRTCEVRIGADLGVKASELQERMERWAKFLPMMEAEEAYFQFEKIHPFEDGNGRVGKIIFNWKKGLLGNPTFPRSFKEDEWHGNTPALYAER